MIRRLIILLLIVGVFAQDELILLNGTSIKGEYVKTEDNIIYFIPDGATTSQRINKDKVREVWINQIDNPSSLLAEAGNHLVQFRKDYYTGFMVSMLGSVASLYGYSKEKSAIIFIGGATSLLGGILMLISFDSAGEAGEDLIDAGEKLEAEQPKEDE